MNLEQNLILSRCPHCRVDQPNMGLVTSPPIQTVNHSGRAVAWWGLYKCGRCGGCVLAKADDKGGYVSATYPPVENAVPATVPPTARTYLTQAINSRHSPAGAVMLAASAVDAMLKAIGLKEGSLYKRIDAAAATHVITEEMAAWAHDVRLDANDERHADDEIALKTETDAERCIEFASALAQFLFVLPEKVRRGREAAKKAASQRPT